MSEFMSNVVNETLMLKSETRHVTTVSVKMVYPNWLDSNDSSFFQVDLDNIETPDYNIDLEYYVNPLEFAENEATQNGISTVKEPHICCISERHFKTENYDKPIGLEYENDDASWIMSSTFMIFTMQTGFCIFVYISRCLFGNNCCFCFKVMDLWNLACVIGRMKLVFYF